MTEMDTLLLSITKRTEAIRAATKEVRRLQAERQVKDALAIRNGPNTISTLSLPILSEVRVWCKKGGWNGPYKLLAINGKTYIIHMPHRPTNFRLTIVKLYYIKEEILDVPKQENQVNRFNNKKELNKQPKPVDPEPII